MASDNETCCLFCLKVFQNYNKNIRGKERSYIQAQFLELLRRHLEEDNVQLGAFKPLGKANEAVTNPCPDCSVVLDSFCEYYKEFKGIEIKLKWRLSTLMDIVRSSKRLKSRVAEFKDKLEEKVVKGTKVEEEINVSNFVEEVVSFRNELLKKCSKKIRSGYPQLKVRKLQSGIESAATPKNLEKAIELQCLSNSESGIIARTPKTPKSTKIKRSQLLEQSLVDISNLTHHAEPKGDEKSEDIEHDTSTRHKVAPVEDSFLQQGIQTKPVEPAGNSNHIKSDIIGGAVLVADVNNTTPVAADNDLGQVNTRILRSGRKRIFSDSPDNKTKLPVSSDDHGKRAKVSLGKDENKLENKKVFEDKSTMTDDLEPERESYSMLNDYLQVVIDEDESTGTTRESSFLENIINGGSPNATLSSMEKKKTTKMFYCSTCTFASKYKTSLLRHSLIHLGSENWQFKCDLCERRFYTAQHKKNHQDRCKQKKTEGDEGASKLIVTDSEASALSPTDSKSIGKPNDKTETDQQNSFE